MFSKILCVKMSNEKMLLPVKESVKLKKYGG